MVHPFGLAALVSFGLSCEYSAEPLLPSPFNSHTAWNAVDGWVLKAEEHVLLGRQNLARLVRSRYKRYTPECCFKSAIVGLSASKGCLKPNIDV